MKWYGWLVILALIVFSNTLTLWITKRYLIKIRVVDTVTLIDRQKTELIARTNQGQITSDEAVAKQKVFLSALQRNLEREPMVFIKQCVLGSHEDITALFEQKVYD